MMRKNNYILYIIILVNLIAIITTFFLRSKLNEQTLQKNELNQDIVLLENRILLDQENIEIKNWMDEYDKELEKFYNPMVYDNIHEFGYDLTEILQEYSIKIVHYSVTDEQGIKSFDYSMQSSPLRAISMLQRITEITPYIVIDFFSLSIVDDVANVRFIIKPNVWDPEEMLGNERVETKEVIDYLVNRNEKTKINPDEIITKLFHINKPMVQRLPQRSTVLVNTAPQNSMVNYPVVNWLSYTGRVKEGSGFLYYFQDTRTSRVYELVLQNAVNDVELMQINDDGFLLNYQGDKIYVKKY